MNKYMRAIGFSGQKSHREISGLIEKEIAHPAYRAYTTDDEDEESLLAQFEIELGESFGIAVCGRFGENDHFFPDYIYPYLDSENISTTEEVSVESRVDNDSFAGICDDFRVGVTLIFRLRNAIEYRKNVHTSFQPLLGASVSLTALSLEGTILLPVYKTPEDVRRHAEEERDKIRKIRAAKNGDDSAARELTMRDMDLYAGVMSHMEYEDVYSVVDTCLMPYGAECELYTLLGEIRSVRQRENRQTGEKLWVLTVDSNGLLIDVMICQKDLYGEPAPGRRFRGVIWLQGRIQFSKENAFSGNRFSEDSPSGEETGKTGKEQEP